MKYIPGSLTSEMIKLGGKYVNVFIVSVIDTSVIISVNISLWSYCRLLEQILPLCLFHNLERQSRNGVSITRFAVILGCKNGSSPLRSYLLEASARTYLLCWLLE